MLAATVASYAICLDWRCCRHHISNSTILGSSEAIGSTKLRGARSMTTRNKARVHQPASKFSGSVCARRCACKVIHVKCCAIVPSNSSTEDSSPSDATLGLHMLNAAMACRLPIKIQARQYGQRHQLMLSVVQANLPTKSYPTQFN